MPKLDPNAEGGGERTVLPAGRYGLAIVWFQRKKAKKHPFREYHSLKVEVTHGKHKGKTFFTMLSLDLTVSGTLSRWRFLSAACGVGEEFEVGSSAENNALEGDENFKRLFVGKPFVGVVGVEAGGKYTNNTISEIVRKSDWTEDEVLEGKVWATEESQDRGDFGPPDDDLDDSIPF